MQKFAFVKNDTKNMLLLTAYFFQVCSRSAPPRDAAVAYVIANIGAVK